MDVCSPPPFLPIPTEPFIALSLKRCTTGLLNPSISQYYNVGLPIKWNLFDPCGSESRTLLKVLLKLKNVQKSHSNAQRLYIFTLTPSQAFEESHKGIGQPKSPKPNKRAAKMSQYWPQ